MMNQVALFRNDRNLLLSLHANQFANMINYEKKFEYRTRFSFNQSKAFVYLSGQGKIAGIIDFGIPIKLNNIKTSEFAQAYDNGSYDEFMSWLNGRNCYIIPIQKIFIIQPIELKDIKKLFPKFTIPQSYYDLDKKKELLSWLKQRTKVVNIIEINSDFNFI